MTLFGRDKLERAADRARRGEDVTDDSKAPYSPAGSAFKVGGAALKVATSVKELNEARASGDEDRIFRASVAAEKESVAAASTVAEEAIKRAASAGREVNPTLEQASKGLGRGEQILTGAQAGMAGYDAYQAYQRGDRTAAIDNGLKAAKLASEAVGKAYGKEMRFAAPVNAVIATRNAMTDFSEVAEMERLRNFNPQDGPMQVWQNRVQGDARMLDTLDEYLTEPRLP